MQEEDDLDAFLYGDSLTGNNDDGTDGNASAAAGSKDKKASGGGATTASTALGSDDSDDDEEDDDLEIVLEPDEGGAEADKRNIVQLKPSQEENVPKMDEVLPLKGSININGIGEYNGQSILNVDLDQIEDKPWAKPGADITDYFNYGFTEATWRAYVIKQRELRGEFGGKQIDDKAALAQRKQEDDGASVTSGAMSQNTYGRRYDGHKRESPTPYYNQQTHPDRKGYHQQQQHQGGYGRGDNYQQQQQPPQRPPSSEYPYHKEGFTDRSRGYDRHGSGRGDFRDKRHRDSNYEPEGGYRSKRRRD